jgi:pantoate--beta-alanine ligase
MGALHEGHLSLVRVARTKAASVAVSIFVNPLQFGPTEDLDRYPRSEEADLKAAEAEGVDIVFAPSVEEMYPEGRATTVTVGGLGDVYEGAVRPDHFDGVATVVTKLFGIVAPDVAVFGQKDAQQLAVIRRVVEDLSLPVEIVAAPTIREEDGLALSSRNAYLSDDQRRRASALWRALRAGWQMFDDGAADFRIVRRMTATLEEDADAVDYVAVVDPDTFGTPSQGAPRLLIVAARFGQTRLIDNLLVERVR